MDLDIWKKRKKEMKCTFDMLAKKSNVPKRTLEDIFSGRTPSPRIDTVQAIEKALGLSECDCDGDTGLSDARLSEAERHMLDTFRKVGNRYGESGQERAVAILELAFLSE